MIVVAELKKPCTDKERADFIVENNHQKGFQIKETKTKIQALDYDDTEKFENAKTAKLEELSSIADNYAQYKCPIDMYIVSSTGFKVDADVCSQTNMQSLILMLGEGESCQYKDFNNEFQTVTREQLTIMVGEAKQNGLSLYNQKFAFEAQINACTTIDEVNAIEIKFKMLDFQKSE